MSFEEFVDIVVAGVLNGEIKIDVPLNELDLAIMYAIGQEQQAQKRTDIIFTAEDIGGFILKHCGKAVYNRIFDEEEFDEG